MGGGDRDKNMLQEQCPVACLPPTQVGEPVREQLQESEGDPISSEVIRLPVYTLNTAVADGPLEEEDRTEVTWNGSRQSKKNFR